MAIIKPGFTHGFRGRKQAAAWNRRAHYLASEHDRDTARLLGLEGQALTPEQAIGAMGGPGVGYHEIIVAPSEAECRTILARNPDHPELAMAEAGQRIAKAYAQGRPAVLAIHEQDGRFHYHIAVKGTQPGQALGKHGTLQKLWDRELFGDEPRIQDWEAHKRFRALKPQLTATIRAQRENERARVEAVRLAAPSQKADAARPFERRGRDFIERRYGLEVEALQARYEARGMLGSPRHRAELESVTHRRTGALRRLEKRELGREMASAQHRVGRGVDHIGRGSQRAVGLAGNLTRSAVDGAMRDLGVPGPVRAVAKGAMILTQEAIQTAIQAAMKVAMEATRTAARSSVHLTTATVKVGIGLAAAVPTAGASLTTATQEAGRDLGEVGRELGQGLARSGAAVVQGAGRAASAGAQELIPGAARMGVQASSSLARTGAGLSRDALSLSPVSAATTVANGALELTKVVTHTARASAPLPEPLRRAFQIAGWVPVVGTAAKAIQLATELAHAASTAAPRGMEMDR